MVRKRSPYFRCDAVDVVLLFRREGRALKGALDQKLGWSRRKRAQRPMSSCRRFSRRNPAKADSSH